MNIENDKLIKIKDTLIQSGFVGDFSEDFDYFLKTKPTTRFINLIKWLRQNNIECNEWTLSSIYKIDVVIRRMISEILKPIELKIKTHVSFLLEKENISINSLKSGAAFENIYQVHHSLFEKKINTTNFVIKTIKNLQRKFNGDLDAIINELMFGQVVALISLFKIDLIEKLFNSIEKIKIINSLEYVVNLRNHIAHHNIIFNIKTLHVNNRNISIKEVINSLHFIAEGDFKEELSSKIENYKNNWIRKYLLEDEAKKDLLTALFKSVSNHIL